MAFGQSPNLRNLLVTANLFLNVAHSNSALPSGSFRCDKNCATCPYIFHGLTNYKFPFARCINSNITWETKNLIYMIQCNRCYLQYIGKTKRGLKDRFNHRQTTLRMRECVTSRYFETVVTADLTNRGKCSIKTSNHDVSFRKLILWPAR